MKHSDLSVAIARGIGTAATLCLVTSALAQYAVVDGFSRVAFGTIVATAGPNRYGPTYLSATANAWGSQSASPLTLEEASAIDPACTPGTVFSQGLGRVDELVTVISPDEFRIASTAYGSANLLADACTSLPGSASASTSSNWGVGFVVLVPTTLTLTLDNAAVVTGNSGGGDAHVTYTLGSSSLDTLVTETLQASAAVGSQNSQGVIKFALTPGRYGVSADTSAVAAVNRDAGLSVTGVAEAQFRLTLHFGPACDSIDFNVDGFFPDTLDIDDFLSVFSGGPCSTGTCGDVDFNNDGFFPDTLDLEQFLSVFSGGTCVV